MLNQVILRLIEICKEKSIIKKNISLENRNDINNIINILSDKTNISKLTLKNIFYKKYKTIRLDILYQLCRELNIGMDYFFDSNVFN